MIRVGVIGLGRMGVSHCAIVNTNTHAKLVAVCEPSGFIRAAMTKHAGLACYKDYREMIDSIKLDCVFITTPTKFHYDMVEYALNAGIHVFVEKPFCLTSSAGKKLVDLAEQKNLINQVGYHNRFIGTFNEAKRLIATKAIGEVYHVVGEAYGPVITMEKGSTWRSKPSEGGGCLYDYATHVINLLQFMIGNPESVSGTVLKSIYSKNVDDAVYAILNFGNGTSGNISVNWSDETFRKMSTQLTLLAKKGKIIVDAQELKVFFKETPVEDVYEKGWNMRWVTDLSPEISFYLRGEEYSAQIEYFINCVREGKLDNVNSFKSAYETDLVVDQLKEDGNKGQVN